MYIYHVQVSAQMHIFPILLIGILSPPKWVEIISSNTTLTVSWWAPPSLETSIPPTISHYVLSNNFSNNPMSISNPEGCKPSMLCNISLDLTNPSFIATGGYYGEKKTNILNYNGTIMFTLLAVNGAGNGNAATFIYMVPKRPQAG